MPPIDLSTKRSWSKQRLTEAQAIRKIRKEMHYVPTKSKFNNALEWICLVGVLMLLFLGGCANAAEYNDKNAILAIIGEAEGEGETGMMAMACAISNRGTLDGVYGIKSPRVTKKLYSKSIYRIAESAWYMANSPDGVTFCPSLIGSADHWGSSIVDGHWIAKMKASGFVQTAKVKNTIFFRKGGR